MTEGSKASDVAPTGSLDDVWVVVAAYNEAERIEETLRRLCTHCANIVVVDDGSTDATAEVVARHPVWLLRHAINCGQGAALQTGIDFAQQHGARVLVTFDADGQHDPAEIAKLVEPVRRGEVEVALGSRFLGSAVDMPRLRRWLLKAAVLLTRLYAGLRVTDTHNGMRAFSRAAAGAIRIRENRMAHASEILHEIRRCGLTYCEVPVTIRYTAASLAKGQTNWNAVKILGRMVFGKLLR